MVAVDLARVRRAIHVPHAILALAIALLVAACSTAQALPQR